MDVHASASTISYLRYVLPFACVVIGWQVGAAQESSTRNPPINAEESLKPPGVDAAHAESMRAGLELFRSDVARILTGRCVKCHGDEKVEGEFDLSTREGLMRGGATGVAIHREEPSQSHLLRLVRHLDDPAMPANGAKLDERQIEQLARWIELGSPYDRALVTHDTDPTAWTRRTIDDAAREFWSFQPLIIATPPPMEMPWARTEVDRFVLAKLAEQSLTPSPMADRRTLIRRAYFDLIGLPPTPDEVASFVADERPEAWTEVIDRLLNSPHYGERWGRHWLDVARFAESHGFEQDYDRPHAYTYRDFVIEALNRDLPFDQFLQWQLAGDEIAPENPQAMMATGFLGAGVFPTQLTEREFEPARYDELDDMVSTVGTAMLGLTIGCARCHDHKYDPLPRADYYRLVATFATTIRSNVELDLDPVGNRERAAAFEQAHQPFVDDLNRYTAEVVDPALSKWILDDQRATAQPQLVPTESEWTAPLKEARQLLSDHVEMNRWKPEQRESLRQWFAGHDTEWRRRHKAVQDHEAQRPPRRVLTAMICSEKVKPIPHHADDRGFPHFYPESYFLRRGDVTQKQGVAAPGYLQVLMRTDDPSTWHTRTSANGETSGHRRALAQWMTDPERGAGHLVARVIVNRIWQHHFGRGIVSTPNDFGFQGDRPTHPELLDWLAARLIRDGWQLKSLHRLMMSSAVYMQSSAQDLGNSRLDPDNRFLWRYAPRRLEAEIIRDAMLKVSGQLDTRSLGPGSLDPQMKRRSIYFTIKRSALVPMMQIFDSPEPLVSIGSRPATTIAPQALLFMNSGQVRECAMSLAQQLTAAPARPLSASIQTAFQMILARDPSLEELAAAQQFLETQSESYAQGQLESATRVAWTDFAQMLLSLNEFVYVD